eukprot:gene11242-7811_t
MSLSLSFSKTRGKKAYQMEERLVQRFMRYSAISSQSCAANVGKCLPTSPGQQKLAELLTKELQAAGLQQVVCDNHATVTAVKPGNCPGCPRIGFICHLDTFDAGLSPDVKAQRLRFTGEDICLNKEKNIWLRVKEHPEIVQYAGQEILFSDGTSVLGADDKAAISTVMEAITTLDSNTAAHGDVVICFVPDEEIGLLGAKQLDVKKRFNVDFAFTIDCCELGEVVYECFNAATVKLTFTGVSTHPMSAKGVMVNPLLMAMDYISSFNRAETPEHTELREGYQWFAYMDANPSRAVVGAMIREHDKQRYEDRKRAMEKVGREIQSKYPTGRVQVEIDDIYANIANSLNSTNRTAIDLLMAAVAKAGVQAKVIPMRGGTDGAALSAQHGLLTPNYFTGAHNFHSAFEFLPLPSFAKSLESGPDKSRQRLRSDVSSCEIPFEDRSARLAYGSLIEETVYAGGGLNLIASSFCFFLAVLKTTICCDHLVVSFHTPFFMPPTTPSDEEPPHVTMRDLAPASILSLPHSSKWNLLKRIGMNNMLSPRAVLQLALNLLGGGKSGLYEGDLMKIYEMVVMEALGAGKRDVAKEYLGLLQKRFGKSSQRIRLLEGMCLEAEGKIPEAKRHYGEMLKADPGCRPVVQRLSTIEKSQGHLREAIRILENELIFVDENKDKHSYLELYPTDASAFTELALLYYEIGDLDKSIYYTEGEVLTDNDSYALHIRLAELYYQKKEFAKSLASYAYSLLMNNNPNNTRAAYGLRQAAFKLLFLHRTGTSKITDETERKEVEELHELVGKKLKTIYAGNPMLPMTRLFTFIDAYERNEIKQCSIALALVPLEARSREIELLYTSSTFGSRALFLQCGDRPASSSSKGENIVLHNKHVFLPLKKRRVHSHYYIFTAE